MTAEIQKVGLILQYAVKRLPTQKLYGNTSVFVVHRFSAQVHFIMLQLTKERLKTQIRIDLFGRVKLTRWTCGFAIAHPLHFSLKLVKQMNENKQMNHNSNSIHYQYRNSW